MLQIQPVYRQREEYLRLAEAYHLKFEVLELCFGVRPEVVRWYADTGLTRSVHGFFIDVNPGSSDKEFRLLSERKCRESCRMAVELGAENVVLHSSCFPNLRGTYLDGWAAYCSVFYQDLAEEFPALRLFIENSFDVDPDPLILLTELTNHPRVQVCLDLGHALCSRTPVQHWINRLDTRIGYFHLSDNKGLFDEHLPLGDGKLEENCPIDILAGRETLPMTLEVGDLNGIRRSIDYLKNNNWLGRLTDE